jgi:hypothetical protein
MRGCGFATLATVLACLPAAAAEGVSYDAPGGCPKADAFEQALQARTQDTRDVRIVVRIDRNGDDFAGRVDVSSGSASRSRSLTATSCSELVDALALSAALSIEEVRQEADSAPAKRTPAPQPRALRKAAPPPSSWRALIGLGGAFRSSVAPGGALGVQLFSELAQAVPEHRMSIRMSLARYGPKAKSTTSGRAEFSWTGGALEVCPWIVPGTVQLAPCAGMDLAALHAEAGGVRFPKSPTRLWWAGVLFGRAAYDLSSRVQLSAALGLDVPFLRPSFSFDTGERVFEVPSAGGRGELGVALAL